MKLITCWKVGRFAQRIVSVRIPGAKRMRSFVASARHAAGSAPWAAWSSLPAASNAAQSDARQAATSPAPQNFVANAPLTGLTASSVRRSLST